MKMMDYLPIKTTDLPSNISLPIPAVSRAVQTRSQNNIAPRPSFKLRKQLTDEIPEDILVPLIKTLPPKTTN